LADLDAKFEQLTVDRSEEHPLASWRRSFAESERISRSTDGRPDSEHQRQNRRKP
jgi:hypothetical protein